MSAIFIFPFYVMTFYKCYFDIERKIIAVIVFAITPIFLVLVFLEIFISMPVHSMVINTKISVFIYHFGKTCLGYKIWAIFLSIIHVLMFIQYFKSKDERKKIPFIVLLGSSFAITLNDTLSSQGYIRNLLLGEYLWFLIPAFVFIDLLFQDRKTYLSVVNLSKELLKHKEELEIKVEERTSELKLEKEISEKERDKSDRLLLNVLPETIATRLKEGETTIADHFSEASVVFIDIVDFTKSSAAADPKRVVEVLNVLYSKLDKIAQIHGLEKIKTIGDCYMAAAGIPIADPDNVNKAAQFALEAMNLLKDYDTGDGTILNFRCGVDCGPVVAGVIGENKFIYDVWGDMVNTASRMETNGIEGKIHCTERFREKLRITNYELRIDFEERGEIEIKGKGMMKTYFLGNSE
ncbi:MAG: domain S-box [Ignavibacteria bacterium]|nr:domain S-box [Ignavibacteria bacterium]